MLKILEELISDAHIREADHRLRTTALDYNNTVVNSKLKKCTVSEFKTNLVFLRPNFFFIGFAAGLETIKTCLLCEQRKIGFDVYLRTW